MPESTYPMLPVADALALVLAQASPLPPVTVTLAAAQGRILAADILAQDALPPFPASVKDGYAVVAADGPGVYPVVGAATAGHMPTFTVTPGTVAYITTGAPLPAGADAVVMVEETEPLDGDPPRVHIRARVQPHADVRPIGYDVAVGARVLPAGTRLGPAEIGILATVGQVEAPVYPQPKVALLSTGDELVDPGQPLRPGQIRDSNRATLRAVVAAAGGAPVDLGIARDDRADLDTRIRAGLTTADMLVTSGGVSMGELDYVKKLLETAGVVHFGRLRMKPGKPLTFATVEAGGRSRLVFGLPGNPVSSLVTFYLLGVPALRKLAGWPDPHLRRITVALAQPLPLDPHRPEYHRAILEWDVQAEGGRGGLVAHSTGNQASSRLLSMRSANALLELPQGEGVLPAGAAVSALLIGEL
jgi:gephyrin